MLPGPHRLRSRHDFNTIYQQGKSWHGPYFVAWVFSRLIESPGLEEMTTPEPTRLGIVVGKKVSKLAVKRNGVKRRMRQACCQLLQQMAAGSDVILIARRGAADLQAEQFLPELEQLLAQAGILYAGY